ncbi:MAG: class GN sortase [Burkholderiaceae bacterium]
MTIGTRLRTAVGVSLLAAGVAVAAHGAWIPAKAWLAQRLIERAWAQSGSDHGAAGSGSSVSSGSLVGSGGSRGSGGSGEFGAFAAGDSSRTGSGNSGSVSRGIRPWPWADTVPVARLHFVRQQQDRVVLEGDSGAVLAFGPGHRVDSPLPADGGNAVISAHRDTHFAVLKTVRPGDPILVETWRARVRGRASPVHYSVVATRIIDADDPAAIAEVLGDAGDDRLSLITCWPFDALAPGTRWRYVVTAVRDGGNDLDPPDPSDSQRPWQPPHRESATMVATNGV